MRASERNAAAVAPTRPGRTWRPRAATGGVALAALLALATLGPARAAGFDGDGPINVDANGVAVKGYDVVAYFRQHEPVEGSPKHEVEYHGATFRFSSAANARRFRADPEKFVPAYGGYCALGVANGYKDDMHPAAFEIVDGRLFFNLSPRIEWFWNQARKHGEDLIGRADANWPELRDAPGYGPRDAR